MGMCGNIRSTVSYFCYKHGLSEKNCLELVQSIYEDVDADPNDFDLIGAISNDYDFYISCDKEESQLKNEIL